MAFQFVDVAVVLIVIVSTVYATYRGFVAETLSIIAWVAAALATLFFGPWIAHLLREAISPSWLGEIVGYASVFLVVVIPLSFMSFRLSQNVKKSQIGTLDRALGGAFGIVRGLAIVGVAYLIFSAIVPLSVQPGWIANARLLPVMQVSAEAIASLVPDHHRESAPPAASRHESQSAAPRADHNDKKVTEVRKTKTAAKPAKKAVKPATKTAAKKHRKQTYGANDRQALDKLIETTDSKKSGGP